jgi:hypothetical protein
MRTLGFAAMQYDHLDATDRQTVDQLTAQIIERNRADRERAVQPIVPPAGAPRLTLPDLPVTHPQSVRLMATIDTSADMTKQQMYEPVVALVRGLLSN